MAGEIPPLQAPPHFPTRPDGGDSGSPSPVTPSEQPAASAGRDTKVFGNLEGRDPDLLFAGEKIMINGKEVTVADGDTLSSLALKHGTTVDKLIAENKMDASLLGKNGQGQYFTPGGPQPAPGGSQNPPASLAPAGTPPNPTAPPQNSDGLWSSLVARDPGMNADDGVFRTEGEKKFGIFGGAITEERAGLLLGRIDRERQNPNSVFTSEQLDRLAQIIAEAPKGDMGMKLSAEEKYAINRLGMAGDGTAGYRPIALEPTLQPESPSVA